MIVMNDPPRKRPRLGNLDEDGEYMWHQRRMDRIARLRQCLHAADGEAFQPTAWGVTVAHRFEDAESNRYADAFAATVRDGEEQEEQALPMALKVLPLATSEARHASTPLSRAALRHSTWTERCALLLCTELVEAACTPSLPCLIRSYSCEGPFSALAEKQKRGQAAVILCNEWARGGNLAQWASKRRRRPAREWHACFFHVFVALYALQKYCALTHHDMHLENILLLNLKDDSDDNAPAPAVTEVSAATETADAPADAPGEGGREGDAAAEPRERYWQYDIDGRTYYVPECLGFVPVLWDFGVAFRPGLCANEAFEHVHPTDEMDRGCSDAMQLLAIVSDMRDAGQISIPSKSWYPYGTLLSWKRWSMRYAIPHVFRRHFGRRPPPGALLLTPTYNLSRPSLRPTSAALQPFFEDTNGS